MNRPLLLGHRGVRGVRTIRENSLQAFDQALADGGDGFELDVRKTVDGRPVVWHDPQFRRTAISRSTAAQLRDLTRLEAVLAQYCPKAFLDIELKVEGLELVTAQLLQKYPPQRGVVVSSFLPVVLETLQQIDESIPLGLICEKAEQLPTARTLPVAYVILHKKLVHTESVDRFHSEGKKVLVWTVNTAREMEHFATLGVDGIVSDKTRLLSGTLNKD